MMDTSTSLIRYRKSARDPKFACNICGLKCTEKANLKRHLRVHEKLQREPKQCCLYCEQMFQDVILLREHILSVHQDQLIEVPDNRFPKASKFKYKCTSCEYIGKTLPDAVRHKRIHTGETSEVEHCKYCNVGLGSQFDRLAHEKKHLNSEGKIHFNCHECPTDCKTAESFHDHFNLHYAKLPHGCNYCTRRFGLPGMLSRHVKKYHQDILPKKTEDGLTNDERVSVESYGYLSQLAPGPERNKTGNLAFFCSKCGGKYFGQLGFQRHLRDHEIGDKYSCPICDMGHQFESYLHTHLEKQHDMKSMREYECSLCNQSIEGAVKFRKHCIEHIEYNKEKNAYVCQTCQSEHRSHLEFVKHLKTHEGIDDNNCESASMPKSDTEDVQIGTTEDSENLMETIKVECDDLPLACKYCSKRFERAGRLSKHILQYHLNLVSTSIDDGLTVEERVQLDCYGVLSQLAPETPRNNAGEVALACKYCGKIVFGYPALRNHNRSHESEELFDCDICGRQFHMRENYEHHMSVHTKTQFKEPQRCLYCKEQFSDSIGLREHIWMAHTDYIIKKKNENTKYYKCNNCNFIGGSVPTIMKHSKIHTGEKHSIHECFYCKVDLATMQGKIAHEAQHIDIEGNVHFDCQKCPAKLETPEAFKNHFMMHYNSLPHGCQYCPRRFEQPGYWACHVEKYHIEMIPQNRNDGLTTSERIYVDCYGFNLVPGPERNMLGQLAIFCAYCDEKHYGFDNILHHTREHEKGPSILLCKYCKLVFNSTKEKRSHEKNHLDSDGNVQFKCDRCSDSYEKVENYVEHYKIHFENCMYCPKRYDRTGDLVRHIEKAHKDMLPEQVDDGLTSTERLQVACYGLKLLPGPQRDKNGRLAILCKICNRKVNGLEQMLVHNKDHELADKYSCLICEEKFPREYPLRLHLKTQHDKKCLKKYNCFFCEKSVKGALCFYEHCISHTEFDKKTNSYGCLKCDFSSSSYLKFVKHFNESQECGVEHEKIGALDGQLSSSDDATNNNNVSADSLKKKHSPLPLTVAVYRAIVDEQCCSIIWCQNVTIDLINIARSAPRRTFMCIMSKLSISRCSQKIEQLNFQVTKMSIRKTNGEDLAFNLLSLIEYSNKTCFNECKEFEKSLITMTNCAKSQSFVRHSYKELQILKQMNPANLTICNYIDENHPERN